LSEFVRVSETFRCPICGHDTWCLVSQDGKRAICPRVESRREWGDVGYEHECDGTHVPPPQTEELPKPIGPNMVRALCELWQRRLTASQMGWLSNNLGLPVSVLADFGVGWKHSCYSFPMFDDERNYVGVRFRAPSGAKWTLKGTAAGLFIPASLAPAQVMFFPEGVTDAAATKAMGYQSVGRPNTSACRDLVLKVIERYKPALSVIVADNDPDGDGIRGATKLLELTTTPARIIYPLRTKDVRAYYNEGSHNDLYLNAAYGQQNRDWGVIEK
jgi:hypothetical protein